MQVKKFLRWGILTSFVVEIVMVVAAWGWTDGMIAIVVCAIVFASLFGLNGVWLSFLGSEVITFAVILVLGRKQ